MAAGQPARGQAAQGQGSGKSPMLFVVIGVGSVAVLLLIGLLFAVLMRGNGNERRTSRPLLPGGQRPEVAEPASRLQPAAGGPYSGEPISTAATPSTAISPEMDHDQIVRRLKDATVYVILKIDGKPIASGSGFVITVHQDP